MTRPCRDDSRCINDYVRCDMTIRCLINTIENWNYVLSCVNDIQSSFQSLELKANDEDEETKRLLDVVFIGHVGPSMARVSVLMSKDCEDHLWCQASVVNRNDMSSASSLLKILAGGLKLWASRARRRPGLAQPSTPPMTSTL